MAFPAQILLPPRAIMTSLAHLDADCPNTHHCQHTEIAVSTVITYRFLKGCSFSTHTAHRGVNTDKEHAELCLEGKSILTFLGQRAVRKKGKGVLLPPVTQSTFGGGQKCCRSHFQPPQNILQSLLLHISSSAESFLEISTRR